MADPNCENCHGEGVAYLKTRLGQNDEPEEVMVTCDCVVDSE